MSNRDRMLELTWYSPAVEELREELNQFLNSGPSVPTEPGGWWHQYVCPEHHTELLFDPLVKNALSYQCPYGCTLEGEPYRGAWLVFKHQSLARYALQAAAVFAATKEKKYALLGKELLVSYARQFPLYPTHPDAQPWMLKGRAFHQALTEGIWSTTLIRAYLLLVDEGIEFDGDDASALDLFFTMLESSMEQYRHILIHEKKNPENNYTAWLNASLAGVYAAKGEEAKLRTLIEGEGGLRHHLTIGVKADGFEFEGSTYYHIFVLRAYLIAAEMANRFGIDLYELKGEEGQSFEGMFDVLVGLSNDVGELPALHDGPYARVPYAREIAEVFEIGLSRYGNPLYVPILAEAYRQMNGKVRRAGVEAVVYGTGDWKLSKSMPARGSLLLGDSGFAVLRQADNPLSVLTDFGPHGGSHGHYDKLMLTLDHRLGSVAPDHGMVPYGSSLRKSWYAETASHNTVSVNGVSQKEHTGECVKYEESNEKTYIWVRSTGAYEGCVMNRHLLVTSQYVLDWFTVDLQEVSEVNWHFHHQGEGTLDGSTAKLLLKPGFQVSVSILAQPGSELEQTKVPGTADDPSRELSGISHRQTGQNASFVTVYKDGDSSAQLSQNEDGTITLRDGNRQWTYLLDVAEGLKLIEII